MATVRDPPASWVQTYVVIQRNLCWFPPWTLEFFLTCQCLLHPRVLAKPLDEVDPALQTGSSHFPTVLCPSSFPSAVLTVCTIHREQLTQARSCWDYNYQFLILQTLRTTFPKKFSLNINPFCPSPQEGTGCSAQVATLCRQRLHRLSQC